MADLWSFTSLGCPDCSGVLSVRRQGEMGLLVFRCTVGHTFSNESLIAAKEEQLENALWTAVELLQEVASVCGELAAVHQDARQASQAELYQGRARLAMEHAQQIRQIIAADGPARQQGPG